MSENKFLSHFMELSCSYDGKSFHSCGWENVHVLDLLLLLTDLEFRNGSVERRYRTVLAAHGVGLLTVIH